MGSSDAGQTREGTAVRDFRQILLWPLQLLPSDHRNQVQRPWERLGPPSPENPWREVVDAFDGDPDHLPMRLYGEFITFLPTVQRFLYGETRAGGAGESPARIFHRTDLDRVRLVLRPDTPPVELAIRRVRLYFFYDINVVILVVETHAENLELETAQEILFRFGRSYPAFWEPDGTGGNCVVRAEWLSPDGEVKAVSDFENQQRYLAFVGEHRVAAISADWMRIMEPLVPRSSIATGRLEYRQLEYLRMPLMAYLALDDPRALTRADFVRLAFATRAGQADRLPFSERSLHDFEASFAYDQFWGIDEPGVSNTRFLCTGNTFVVVGDAHNAFFTGAERGVLGQFRHQYFLLGLIAHFHKAALLMFRERLENSVSRLNIRDAESIKGFKRQIRMYFEIFLRFTHRYWFSEVSLQAPAKPLFAMFKTHLGTVELYDEIRRDVQDMAQYLDSDGLRRQANTVVRLTVVTTVSVIGMITTGFLGMNLIDATDEPLPYRIVFFLLVFALSSGITIFAIGISKRLSEFLELLSDERLPLRKRLGAFYHLVVWRK